MFLLESDIYSPLEVAILFWGGKLLGSTDIHVRTILLQYSTVVYANEQSHGGT